MSFKTLFLDLDGTLYPHNNGIWEQISVRMNKYMTTYLGFDDQQVSKIREQYFHKYGTTLRGLMATTEIDPKEYLAYVHDIRIGDYIKPDLKLKKILSEIPQPKWILTNADTPHATRVLNALGIFDLFEGILDITIMGYENKPNPLVFQKALEFSGGLNAADSLFVDDIPKNVAAAKQLGWQTILVSEQPNQDAADHRIEHIHQLGTILAEVGNG
ncbi:MAG: pyrimidine 5'-nucleotidase [Chloroflexota bacterium]